MSFQFLHPDRGTKVAAQIHAAGSATREMVIALAALARSRLSLPSHAVQSAHLNRLIEDGALVDAMLMLIEFELPQWQLRRLTYDEGEWHCALSRQRELPDWLDRAVEAHHPDLSLAMAAAFVETIAMAESAKDTGRAPVPRLRSERFQILSCDNFA